MREEPHELDVLRIRWRRGEGGIHNISEAIIPILVDNSSSDDEVGLLLVGILLVVRPVLPFSGAGGGGCP